MRFFACLTLLIVVTVESVNSHSSNFHSHARRSMDIIKRQGLFGDLGGNPPPSPSQPNSGGGGGLLGGVLGGPSPPPASTSPSAGAGGAVGGLLNPVVSIVKPVASPVVSAINPVVTPVVSAINPVVTPVASALNPVVKPVASGLAPVVSAVGSVAAPVASVVGSVAAPVATAVGSVVAPVASAVGSVAAPVVSAVGSVAAPVATAVGSVVAPVASAVGSVAAPVASVVGSVAAPVASVVGSVAAPVASVVASAAAPVASVVGSVAAPVASVVASAAAPVASVVASAAAPVASVVASAAAPVASVVASVAAPVASVVASVATPVASVVASVATPVASVVGSVASPVTSLLAPATSLLGPVTSILPPVTSILPPVTSILAPVTSVLAPVTSILAPVTSVLAPVTSILPPVTSILPPATSLLGPVTSILPPVTSIIPSVLAPATSILVPVTSALPPVISLPPPVTSILQNSGTPTFTPPSETIASTAPEIIPSISSAPLVSIISFPQPSTATVPIITNSPVEKATTMSIDSQISFILSISSLALNTLPTTPAISLTNPDQASSTALPITAVPTTLLPLPSGMPARIYPPDRLDPNTDLTGFTFIAILFDLELNWPFVVLSPVSSTQIFAYIPIIIATALGIDGTQILTWALQVYIPTTYQTPADAAQLGTLWLGYVPSDLVTSLSQEILAKQSKFYTGESDNVAKALASHVNAGFSILSVSDPNSGGPSSSDGGQTRRDVIIGVVSSLGGIAFFVLAFLAYRVMKNRRDHAHMRLTDPPDAAGVRPEGQDFDQDSVGGARRRSFYYAEDSLRGFQDPEPELNPGPSMTERRLVTPGTPISPPVLQENSLNW